MLEAEVFAEGLHLQVIDIDINVCLGRTAQAGVRVSKLESG